MNSDRPLILISNDDGYDAPGINLLAEIAQEMGDVIVAAPMGGRSGAAMSVTFSTPLTVKKIRETDHLSIYACNGTPVDCIKLALSELCPRRPDLILGGINHGDNSAVNVHYSGTMGIVLEGCLKGIPSIGFSYCSHDWKADLSPMRKYIVRVMRHVLSNGLPQGVCLNVNAPDMPQYKGLKTCRMGLGHWTNELFRQQHPRSGQYYWLVGEFGKDEEFDPQSDFAQLREGYVTITPIQIDVTAWAAMDTLQALCTD